MDPIGAITSITGQVLRRIADALDTPPAQPSAPPVHIDTIHVHITGTATHGRAPRIFGRGNGS